MHAADGVRGVCGDTEAKNGPSYSGSLTATLAAEPDIVRFPFEVE